MRLPNFVLSLSIVTSIDSSQTSTKLQITVMNSENYILSDGTDLLKGTCLPYNCGAHQ